MIRGDWSAALAALALGCGGPVPLPEPPDPPTAALEAPVRSAIAEARRRVVAEPRSAAAWGRLAMTLHAHDYSAEAVEAYAVAERLEPGSGRWAYLAGRALESVDRAAARVAYERALVSDGEALVVLQRLGELLLELGEPEQAAECFADALALEPGNGFAELGLARVAASRGRVDEAQKRALAAVSKLPRSRAGHQLLAQLAQRRGDGEEAARLQLLADSLPVLLPDDPYYAEVEERGASALWLSRRAIALAEQGRYPEAERELRKSVAIRRDATALGHLGATIAAQGREGEALALWDEALEAAPLNLISLVNSAPILAQLGRVDEGIARLEQALVADPRSVPALARLAGLVGSRGDLARAAELAQRAVAIAPADLEALEQLARVRLVEGRIDEAIALDEQILELAPDRLATTLDLSRALALRGRHSAAIGRLRSGLHQAPNSSALTLFLAWELATAPDAAHRDPQEALRHAQRVARAQPRSYQAADVLAAAFAAMGRFDEAVEAASVAVGLAGASGDAASIEQRLALYRQRLPYRSSP